MSILLYLNKLENIHLFNYMQFYYGAKVHNLILMCVYVYICVCSSTHAFMSMYVHT